MYRSSPQTVRMAAPIRKMSEGVHPYKSLYAYNFTYTFLRIARASFDLKFLERYEKMIESFC